MRPGRPEHQAVGDRMEPVVPDGGAHRFRRHEVVAQPDAMCERHRFGHPGEEGVGAFVDAVDAGERRGVDLAADPVGCLEHLDVDIAGVGQAECRRQPADAAADHGDTGRVDLIEGCPMPPRPTVAALMARGCGPARRARP